MQPDRELSPLLSTSQAAAYLGLAPGTLRVWRHSGRADQPAYVKVGRAVKYLPRELARYVNSRTEKPGRKDCDPRRQQRRRGPQ